MNDLSLLHQRQFRQHWVEKRPEPLQMTSDEIVAFLDEYEVVVTWKPASAHFPRICTLTSDWFETTKGATLREAVCLAAAKVKEANCE